MWDSVRENLPAHLTLLRVALFFCCAGYFAILYAWVKPSPEAVRRAVLATFCQFIIGLGLDVFFVRSEIWTYREMPFSLYAIPIDLHINWSMLWGFGLCWLSDRLLKPKATGGQAFIYVLGWTLFTLALDISISPWMIFLESAHSVWWLFDIALLMAVQGFTLWLYRSIGRGGGHSCGLGKLPALTPWIRSVLYMSIALALFFFYLPEALDAALVFLEIEPQVDPASDQRHSPGVLVFSSLGLILGLWSTHEFATRGGGTPIPWDAPPRLVCSGPYAFTANPMQQSGILLGVAVFLAAPSWVRFGYLADLGAIVVIVLMVERHQLNRRFQGYDHYRKSVGNFRWRSSPYEPRAIDAPLLFIDDKCAICCNFVELLEASKSKNIRVQSLSGELAARKLSRKFITEPFSMVLVEPSESGGDQISTRAYALYRITAWLPLPWTPLSLLSTIPGAKFLGNVFYRWVATRRR